MNHALFKLTTNYILESGNKVISQLQKMFKNEINKGTIETTLRSNTLFAFIYLVEKNNLPDIKIVPDYKQIDLETYIVEFYYDYNQVLTAYNKEIDNAFIPELIKLLRAIDEENKMDLLDVATHIAYGFHGFGSTHFNSLERQYDERIRTFVYDKPYEEKILNKNKDKIMSIITNELEHSFIIAKKNNENSADIFQTYNDYINPQIKIAITEHIDALNKIIKNYAVPEKILEEVKVQFSEKISPINIIKE